MPAAAEERVAEYARTWRERGIRAWGEGWWTMPLEVGDQIGRIVGAPPGAVGMHQNVTIAAAIVLSALDLGGERNRIVYAEGEFPSVRYLLQAQDGTAPRSSSCRTTGAVLDAIDERTLLVAAQPRPVQDRRAPVDPEPIVRRAHEAGAHVFLDAYQSVGAVPLDVTALGVDFGDGRQRQMALRRARARLALRAAGPRRAARAGVHRLAGARAAVRVRAGAAYAQGAQRFLTGTPNIPALYAATAGYDLIEELGVDPIRSNSLRLTTAADPAARRGGPRGASARDPRRRGGTVCVRTPHFEAVHKELAERQILCDFRPDVGLRLGPHYFTTEDELAFAVDQIAEIVESGAYERHLGAVARF